MRVYRSSPDGREQVLFVARQNEAFNDVPVFDGGPNAASASALENSLVLLLPKEAVFQLLRDCPPAVSIIKVLAQRLRNMTTLVSDLSFRSVVSRLCKLLLELAVAQDGKTPPTRLTQEEMAAMVGSVRDVIGRALRLLEKRGAIAVRRQQIVVIDQLKLKELL